MTPLFLCVKRPASHTSQLFQNVVISLLVSMVPSAAGGYRLQFVDRGKRDQKIFIKTFAMKFWTTIPTSTPFPSSSSPLDAIDIGAWPRKAQAS